MDKNKYEILRERLLEPIDDSNKYINPVGIRGIASIGIKNDYELIISIYQVNEDPIILYNKKKLFGILSIAEYPARISYLSRAGMFKYIYTKYILDGVSMNDLVNVSIDLCIEDCTKSKETTSLIPIEDSQDYSTRVFLNDISISSIKCPYECNRYHRASITHPIQFKVPVWLFVRSTIDNTIIGIDDLISESNKLSKTTSNIAVVYIMSLKYIDIIETGYTPSENDNKYVPLLTNFLSKYEATKCAAMMCEFIKNSYTEQEIQEILFSAMYTIWSRYKLNHCLGDMDLPLNANTFADIKSNLDNNIYQPPTSTFFSNTFAFIFGNLKNND